MDTKLAEKFEHRKLGIIDEEGRYFESLEALAKWEENISRKLEQADEDIKAGRVYSLNDAKKRIKNSLDNK